MDKVPRKVPPIYISRFAPLFCNHFRKKGEKRFPWVKFALGVPNLGYYDNGFRFKGIKWQKSMKMRF